MTIAKQVINILRQNGPMSYKSIHQSLTSTAATPASVPSLKFLKEKVMKPLRKNNVIRALPPSALEQLQLQQQGAQDGSVAAAASKSAKSAKELHMQNKGTWQFVAVERRAQAKVQRRQVILRDFPRYEDAIAQETAEVAVKA